MSRLEISPEQRSVYFTHDVCQKLEAPKELFCRGTRINRPRIDAIATFALRIVLALPAAAGYVASRVVYMVRGEKITKDYYDVQLGLWREKLLNVNWCPVLMEKVIDGFISRKIKPESCPYEKIVPLGLHSSRGNVFTIFGFEGPLDPWSNHPVRNSAGKILILMAPQDNASEKQMIDWIRRYKIQPHVPTNEEVRSFYSGQKEDKARHDRCSYVWISSGSSGLSSYVDSSTIKAIIEMFKTCKERG